MSRSLVMKILVVLLLCLSAGMAQHPKTKVLVEIVNLRSAKGVVGIGVYTNDDDFKNEKEYILQQFEKAKMLNGKLVVELYLPPGTYGLALLDDENENGEMDFSWMIPQEGFGFSNYTLSGLSRPDFEDFQFIVGPETTKVQVKMKYL